MESDKLKGALLDIDGRKNKQVCVKLNTDTGNHEFQEAVISLIDKLSMDVAQPQILTGIGFSLPGFSDLKEKTWVFNSRWPNVKKFSFASIEARYGYQVSIDQKLESKLAMLVDKTKRLEKANVFLVHWGFGIGGAYAHQGKVLHSKYGSFAEIGHTKNDCRKSLKCRCGEEDCIETVAAGWAIIPYLNEKFGTLPENEIDLGKEIQNVDLSNDSTITTAIKAVGRMINTVCHVFCPEYIFFYGPFFSNRFVKESIRYGIENSSSSFSNGIVVNFIEDDLSDLDPTGVAIGFIIDALKRSLLPVEC